MRAPVLALALATGVSLAASVARAQVSLSTEVSPRKVEVGDRFMLRLRAMSQGDDRATSPELKLPSGVTGSGPNVGSQTQMSIVNGQMTQSVGITATWVLSASAPGTYRLGPASVLTSSGRKQDRVVTVEVVPRGSMPRSQGPSGGQPFDPWGMLRGMGGPNFPGFPGFSDLDQPREPELPQPPEEYRVDRALDPIAFLRARAVPKKVVVGEQVTLSVYAYGGRGEFRPGTATEPSRDDFLAINVMDDTAQIAGYPFELDGQQWITAKFQSFALFPLKSGKLKAGAMSLSFVGRGYSKDALGLKRESQPIEIVVVEPPLEGRPPGYKLGDVGHYDLSAQLDPREVPAGGSISVVAKLEGTGYVPASLLVPEQNGVRWLEPQIIEQVAPRSGVVQGFRTFTYVVELNQPGDIDLGELKLPYWDPKARAYGVARAALGKVKVTGNAPLVEASAKAEPGHKLKGLLELPSALGASANPKHGALTERAPFWLALLGAPLTALLGFALADLAALLRRRRSERRGSLATATDEALAQLAGSGMLAEPASIAAATERALFLSIERATGLKARGVLKSELASALARVGVEEDVAARAAALLGRCDELRFAGDAADLAAFAAEARDTCRQLISRKRRVLEGPDS
ncbi:MAG TPA: BatD family protein [Polyangiaceae bacterium]